MALLPRAVLLTAVAGEETHWLSKAPPRRDMHSPAPISLWEASHMATSTVSEQRSVILSRAGKEGENWNAGEQPNDSTTY